MSLQNVFELVEALGDDEVESKIMKQAENPEIQEKKDSGYTRP